MELCGKESHSNGHILKQNACVSVLDIQGSVKNSLNISRWINLNKHGKYTWTPHGATSILIFHFLFFLL